MIVVAHTFNLSTWETEEGQISEFEVSLVYTEKAYPEKHKQTTLKGIWMKSLVSKRRYSYGSERQFFLMADG